MTRSNKAPIIRSTREVTRRKKPYVTDEQSRDVKTTSFLSSGKKARCLTSPSPHQRPRITDLKRDWTFLTLTCSMLRAKSYDAGITTLLANPIETQTPYPLIAGKGRGRGRSSRRKSDEEVWRVVRKGRRRPHGAKTKALGAGGLHGNERASSPVLRTHHLEQSPITTLQEPL